MLTHSEAADVVRFAFLSVTGRSANRHERQLIQAWGLLETAYGSALGGNNWGANLALAGEPYVEHGDTRPENGKDVHYVGKFRAYVSPAEGCAGMIRVIASYPGALDAARVGDVKGYCQALYNPKPGRKVGYFSGIAKDTPAERVARRARSIVTNAITAAKVLHEDVLTYGAWDQFRTQDCRKLAPSGLASGIDVKRFQAAHGLTTDGIIGPATWAAILLETK